ncbi:MAG: nickel pincer cofactor biosynthesis protein LarC [Anaerolineae bacterium]
MSPSPRIAYLDCYSGISGDMFLGALLDVGLALEDLEASLRTLPLRGYSLHCERQVRGSVSGTRVHVRVEETEQPHRHLADIEAILEGGGLPRPVQERARAVFHRLARAEARVHHVPVEEVHFHEVGAVDAIVDVVGTVLGLHLLGVTEVYCSPLPLGSGFVQTAHGQLPIPAPATLALLAEVGAPTTPTPPAQAELVTPTGAALVGELARFGRPAMRLEALGYGFGQRDLPWPNALRLWLGRALAEEPWALDVDATMLLECNLDDLPGQNVAFAMEEVLREGALDAWLIPIQMKKGRPGILLSVLARPEDAPRLAYRLLEETSTLGVREAWVHRWKAEREQVTVETPWGPVRVKCKRWRGKVWDAWPEYEDCAALARETGVPLAHVQRVARQVALDRLGAEGGGEDPGREGERGPTADPSRAHP